MSCNSKLETSANKSTVPQRSAEQVEQIVALTGLHPYHLGMPCSTVATGKYLQAEVHPGPLPSVYKIGRILALYGLTHKRTGWLEGGGPDWLPKSAYVEPDKRKSFSICDKIEPYNMEA